MWQNSKYKVHFTYLSLQHLSLLSFVISSILTVSFRHWCRNNNFTGLWSYIRQDGLTKSVSGWNRNDNEEVRSSRLYRVCPDATRLCTNWCILWFLRWEISDSYRLPNGWTQHANISYCSLSNCQVCITLKWLNYLSELCQLLFQEEQLNQESNPGC